MMARREKNKKNSPNNVCFPYISVNNGNGVIHLLNASSGINSDVFSVYFFYFSFSILIIPSPMNYHMLNYLYQTS